MKHWHMKINQMVILYIDKNEKDPSYPRFEWPTVDPKYSTLKEISKMYCHMMCGRGRVAPRPASAASARRRAAWRTTAGRG
jgi:hypothetical protein